MPWTPASTSRERWEEEQECPPQGQPVIRVPVWVSCRVREQAGQECRLPEQPVVRAPVWVSYRAQEQAGRECRLPVCPDDIGEDRPLNGRNTRCHSAAALGNGCGSPLLPAMESRLHNCA